MPRILFAQTVYRRLWDLEGERLSPRHLSATLMYQAALRPRCHHR